MLRFIQMDDPKEKILAIDFGVIRSQEQDIMQRLQTKAVHG